MSKRRNVFERASQAATSWTGKTPALVIAFAVIIVWGATGPIFGYSDTWQLVINTSTTIVTFLMVFLIQRAQNKESRALELKLNEIVAALQGASNHLIDVESLSEHEIEMLHRHYVKLAQMAKRDVSITQSHSVEEARVRHARKKKRLSPKSA
jgi:low affinity Fe/Cu permease